MNFAVQIALRAMTLLSECRLPYGGRLSWPAISSRTSRASCCTYLVKILRRYAKLKVTKAKYDRLLSRVLKLENLDGTLKTDINKYKAEGQSKWATVRGN